MPWSAASLASGAVLLVLGGLALPVSGDPGGLVDAVETEGGRWLLASFAFFLASVGLTMGLPAIIRVLPAGGSRLGMVGIWVFAFGTIGTAGYAALLLFFRATVLSDLELTAEQVRALGDEPAMATFTLGFTGAFYLGELLVALALFRSRAVGAWVPALMVLHVALVPFVRMMPPEASGMTTVVAGVALMGVAVRASEAWAAEREPVLAR